MAPHDTGPQFYGWAQRLAEFLREIHGLTVNQLGESGTNAEDWTNPNHSNFLELMNALDAGPRFLLIGLSLDNEEISGGKCMDHARTLAESKLCGDQFIAGINQIVDDAAVQYSVPAVIGGVYANGNLSNFQTKSTYETNEMFKSSLSWARGKYIDFLPKVRRLCALVPL